MLAPLPRPARFMALITTEKFFFTLLLLYKNISTEDSLGFNFKVKLVLVLLEVWGVVKIWLQFWNGGKIPPPFPHFKDNITKLISGSHTIFCQCLQEKWYPSETVMCLYISLALSCYEIRHWQFAPLIIKDSESQEITSDHILSLS